MNAEEFVRLGGRCSIRRCRRKSVVIVRLMPFCKGHGRQLFAAIPLRPDAPPRVDALGPLT